MKKSKLWVFSSLVLALSLYITFSLFQSQIRDSRWKSRAQGQQRVFQEVRGKRGEIYATDRLGNRYLLAVDRDWEFLYISPKELNEGEVDIPSMAQSLASILNLNPQEIINKANKKEETYTVIKKRLSQEEVSGIREIALKGLYIKKEPTRYYPQGSLASHLTGFFGGSGEGQYGIEGYHNKRLEGRGEAFSSLVDKVAGGTSSGEEIILTIDYNIQFMAEKLLLKAKEELNIDGGTILVSEPSSGKVLAMANYPTFNPNEYFLERDFSVYSNPAITFPYEPGSIFKPITMAIALEEGKIGPETTYNDLGFLKIGGYTINNYGQRTWGLVTMTEALEKSINTAAVFAKDSVGNKVFGDYLERFQLFSSTKIPLQGEVVARNESFKEGYDVNFATASYGQGVSFTTIQLIKAFSALANGGWLIDPYIIEGDGGGQGERVISQKTSADITSMMVSVTENGSAKRAQVKDYYVAGKTGTAQVPWSELGIDKKGYSNKTIQSFIGYAPAYEPAFIILIKLNNPNLSSAEYSVTPIFSELAKYIIDYLQIAPERE